MEKVISILDIKSNIKTYLIDFTLLVFIYFIPAISHLFAFPIYYLDPMRIALVVALLFTSKRNAFLIALTLPVFSYAISSHPQIMKAFLLSAELIINLGVFLILTKKINNIFISFFVGVLISKVVYYLLKFISINLGLIEDKLFSTPIYYQIGIAVVLSGFLYWRLSGSANNSDTKNK